MDYAKPADVIAATIDPGRKEAGARATALPSEQRFQVHCSALPPPQVFTGE
jgi:hypothetical protein